MASVRKTCKQNKSSHSKDTEGNKIIDGQHGRQDGSDTGHFGSAIHTGCHLFTLPYFTTFYNTLHSGSAAILPLLLSYLLSYILRCSIFTFLFSFYSSSSPQVLDPEWSYTRGSAFHGLESLTSQALRVLTLACLAVFSFFSFL